MPLFQAIKEATTEDITRAAVTIIIAAGTVFLLATSHPVPDLLSNAFLLIIGYLFGRTVTKRNGQG